MENTKPLVTAAVICDQAIIDAEGVASLIRLVDKITFSVPPNVPPNITPSIQLLAFFSIKSGALRGKSELSIKLRRPDGTVAEIPEKWWVVLNGDEHGAQLKLTFGLAAKAGLYWLELYWNGEFLAATPFRLIEAESDQPKPDKS
jgi:hypothetical protein